MDENRKRVIGIMAAIHASLHMQTADDLFGTPQGSPRTDKLIDASIQRAERILTRISQRCTGAWVPVTISAIVDAIRSAEQIMAEIDRRWDAHPRDRMIRAHWTKGTRWTRSRSSGRTALFLHLPGDADPARFTLHLRFG